jgi:hypothetical protein
VCFLLVSLNTFRTHFGSSFGQLSFCVCILLAVKKTVVMIECLHNLLIFVSFFFFFFCRTFTRWGDRSGGVGVGKEKYHHFMFENGAHCWNGPSRSVEVSASCGAENKILSVSEPSKCEVSST